MFATGVIYTSGKFAAGIVDTGGKFATDIYNTSKTGGKICRRCRWYQWCKLTCKYLRKVLKKFENGHNGILWGWGETDS